MTGKGNNGQKRKPIGLDEIQVTTSETDVPSPYFAGIAQLNVSWVMNPVIAFTKPSNTTGKGK
jgi:hypothetical protein